MRRLLSTLAVATVLAVPAGLEAQVTLGPTAAFHDKLDFGIGAMVGARLPAVGGPVGVLGDFTFFFPEGDNVDAWELNGNLTWDLPIDAVLSPFVLGGLNVVNTSVDGGPQVGSQSDTEVGLNLGGGIRFDAGTLNPMLGVRAEIDGGEGAVIFATLPFAVGGG